MIRNGRPGRTTRTVPCPVEGMGSITVKYARVKGGTAQTTIALQ